MIYWIATLVLVLAGAYFLWYVSKRGSKGNEPPMVSYWIPWLGNGLQYQKNPLSFLRNCMERYGPIFTVHMGGRYLTFVTDPFTHPTIAREGRKLNFRLQTIPFTKKVFGFQRNGVEEATAGDFPKHLQGIGLEELSKVMLDNLHCVLKKPRFLSTDWTGSKLLDLSYEVMFTAGFKTLFGAYSQKNGVSTKKDDYQAIIKDFMMFDDAFPLLVQGYPITSLKGVKEARERLLGMFDPEEMDQRESVHAILNSRRRELEEKDRSNEYPGVVLALLWGAESNTVLAAFWTLYYVLKDPEALKAARKEINELIEKTSQTEAEDINLTRNDIESMTVLESIVNESLRLRDSPSMLRLATEDYDLKVKSQDKTYRIRKDDSVMVVFQLTHMDPKIYDDPEKFKFDRFQTGDGKIKTVFKKNGKEVKFHLQPFGSGLSKCPGRYFALIELKQFLITMLHFFDIELTDPDRPVGYAHSRTGFGSLPPTGDVAVRFKRRGLINNNEPSTIKT